jgi:hypothetical protein
MSAHKFLASLFSSGVSPHMCKNEFFKSSLLDHHLTMGLAAKPFQQPLQRHISLAVSPVLVNLGAGTPY